MACEGYVSMPSNNNSSNFATVNSAVLSVRKVIIAVFSIFVIGLLARTSLLNYGEGGFQAPLQEAYSVPEDDAPLPEDDAPSHWPDYLISRNALPEYFPTYKITRPTNTEEAEKKDVNGHNWVKSREACDPLLGEQWLYRGKHSYNTSVTMYFTPSVGAVPGILSGIEVDVYDCGKETCVGPYYSEERQSDDGFYHSIAIALQDGAQHNLCDSETAFAPTGEKYIAIRSGRTYEEVPRTSDLAALKSQWVEGSFIPGMGFHWFQDTEDGPFLSYKAGKLVPVSVMYDPLDKEVNAIFFLGVGSKSKRNQGYVTWWDQGRGLVEDNDSKYPFCINFCGKCAFKGSPDNRYSTMHWWFRNPESISWKDEEISCGDCDGKPCKKWPGYDL